MARDADGGLLPSFRRRIGLGAAGVLAFVILVSLGTWQVQRLAWKRALIEQVDGRVHAASVAAPGPAAWPTITSEADAYRRVVVSGVFDDRTTAVQAVTVLGGGVWVMSPLRTDAGWTVLVNRGFVSAARRDAGPRADPQGSGPATVTGLLRMSEPNGAFLQTNDPGSDRWVSRDVAAIAAARRIGPVAPYFIDADARDGEGPVGGLTVVAFANNHLLYAIVWFGLASLLAGAGLWSIRGRLGIR